MRDEAREAARRQECKQRTEQGGCYRVDQAIGWRSLYSIDDCDNCMRAGPETDDGASARDAGAARLVRLTISRGLSKAHPEVRKAALVGNQYVTKAEARQALLAACPHIPGAEAISLALAVGGPALAAEAKRRAVNALEAGASAAAQRACKRKNLLNGLGEANLAALAGEAPLLVRPSKQPRVALAIAARDEGPDLEVTVATACAWQTPPDLIAVVVDGDKNAGGIQNSLRAICQRAGVELIVDVNDKPRGSGPSKHAAVERCLAFGPPDIVVVSDSHMRFPWDFSETLAASHYAHPTAVLWPVSRGFDRGGFRGRNTKATFTGVYWKAEWDGAVGEDEACPRTPFPMGGCYAVPAAVLPRLGGYAPCLLGYGYEEEWLGMRAWLFGAEVRCMRDAEVQHQYRRKTVPPRSVALEWWNRAVALRLLLGQDQYNEAIQPGLLAAARAECGEEFNEVRLAMWDKAMEFERQVQVCTKRPVREVLSALGMNISPQPVEI